MKDTQGLWEDQEAPSLPQGPGRPRDCPHTLQVPLSGEMTRPGLLNSRVATGLAMVTCICVPLDRSFQRQVVWLTVSLTPYCCCHDRRMCQDGASGSLSF